MADDTPKPGTATPPRVGLPKMRAKHRLLLIVLCLVLVAFIRQGFVFFVIGMLPSIVAYYMDVSRHRYTFRSIFAANLAGMLPYLVRIMHQGPSSALLHGTMGDFTNWLIIYGAAGLGWLLIMVCPMLSQRLVQGMHEAQLARYEQLQKKLESEWGPEVTQFSGDHPATEG